MKNLINRSRKDTLNWTTSRSYYNKLRKIKLEMGGEIRCSYCPYHKYENRTTKWYGSTNYIVNDEEIQLKEGFRKPSWKLATKNRKQWMAKPKSYKTVYEPYIPHDRYIWVEIMF